MLTKDTKLRFWCQKVLPLVYDDSLSYYELLNKVVLHLNQHTEDINALIDFYDTFTETVEDVIRQMMDDGDFNEIVADTLGSIVAEEYDPTKSYIIFDYCIFESKLYRANGSTTGVFDPEKWVERTVGYDLTTIQNYIYSLNAGNVAYDPTSSYPSGSIGNKIKNLSASDIANASLVLGDDVGDALNNLLNAINNLTASDVANSSLVTGTDVGDALNTLYNAINTFMDVDISTLTDTWLLTAKDGIYKATGASRIGTFIENADNNFGLLTIASAPHGSNDYGYITFHSTTGKTFYRDFTRSNNTITWRTALQQIALETEIISLNDVLNGKVNISGDFEEVSITSDATNSLGIIGTDSEDSVIFILRARENGRVGFDKYTNGVWTTLYELANTADIASIAAVLNALCIKGPQTTINQAGTYNVSCTGLTANHKVCNWGLFSDSGFTTPIDENYPPADITITEGNGSYDITIANYSSTFYIQPTFILAQNS